MLRVLFSEMALTPSPAGPERARFWVRPTIKGEAGLRHLFAVSLPLVLSSVSLVINLFFDRYFLAKYDLRYHMTASLTASMMWWTIQNLGLGLVTYASTFVAQYHGADRPHRIGASVWQAVYLGMIAGALNLALIPLFRPFFHWIHPGDPKLASLEGLYCELLTIGSPVLMVGTALSCFFSGQGRTRMVMVVSFITAGVNIALNRWWIFSPPDWLPFMEPGLSGAAWATNVSFGVSMLIYALFFFRPRNEHRFRTRSTWRFDWLLVKRMVRYGFPQAMHHIVEVAAWTFFFLMVGRVSHNALTASNIAFTLNILLFVPMVGLAQGVSILMGQFIGKGSPNLGEKATSTALIVCFLTMETAALCYVFIPEVLISVFMTGPAAQPVNAEIIGLAKTYLLFVAVYSLADVFGIIYANAIKGAGDTKFVMIVAGFSSVFILAVPSLIAAAIGWPAWSMWLFAVLYVYATAVLYVLRYLSGRWKAMKVIEPELVGAEDLGQSPPRPAVA